MKVEIVCPSRDLFGSDRSALRLAVVLRSLGAKVWLTAPTARPELGLAALAAERGIEVREGPVAVVSSRGIVGGASALRRPSPGAGADLTIYNSAAVAWRRGASGRSVLVLREWLEPASLRHRLLCAAHARRTNAVVAVSSQVKRQWKRCTDARLPSAVIPNWLEEDWVRPEVVSRPRARGFCS